MRITFITPRLPPVVCGLADHTRCLAEALVQQGVAVGFIHRQAGQREFALPAGPVDCWDDSARSLVSLVQRQNPEWLWVQLSGYGYSRWGAPYHLARALAAVRRALPRVRIAVYLHEPHCDAEQLGFKGVVLSAWQKYTVGTVVRMADTVFTSTELWRRRILTFYRSFPDRVLLLPLGSHVPAANLSPNERSQERRALGWSDDDVVAVTFGSQAMQLRALERFAPLLETGLAKGLLHRVVCMGGERVIPAALAEWGKRFSLPQAFQPLGHRPAVEIGRILACGDFAFLATPRPLLLKSTAFVAAAEAGLAILTLPEPRLPVLDELPPVVSAETWDWDLVRSPEVAEMRRAIHCYAAEHHAWPTIARRALAVLGTTATAAPAPVGS